MDKGFQKAASAGEERPQKPNFARLRDFLRDIGGIIGRKPSESLLLAEAEPLLAELVMHDDWLPESCAQPGAESYRQYLLHCDSQERFSLVSFVWGAGQSTPIHDHRTWGLIGMLRGSETSESWTRAADGSLVSTGPSHRLRPGDTDRVSPRLGDIHRVANLSNEVAISIHLYGANIGRVRRAIYKPDGSVRPFISGYADADLPNVWQA